MLACFPQDPHDLWSWSEEASPWPACAPLAVLSTAAMTLGAAMLRTAGDRFQQAAHAVTAKLGADVAGTDEDAGVGLGSSAEAHEAAGTEGSNGQTQEGKVEVAEEKEEEEAEAVFDFGDEVAGGGRQNVVPVWDFPRRKETTAMSLEQRRQRRHQHMLTLTDELLSESRFVTGGLSTAISLE